MENKIRVNITIDKKVNQKFKNRYPQLMSRYIEYCIKEALENPSKINECIKAEPKPNIFNWRLKK